MIEGIGRLQRYLQRVGGGIYRFSAVCFIILGLWGFSQSLSLKRMFGESRLSDWSKVKVELDYATNILPYHRYTGRWAEYMRSKEYQRFGERILAGDTLKVGMDYYALTNMSRIYLLDSKREFTFFQSFPFAYYSIENGGVEIFEASQKGGWVWVKCP